MEIECYDHRLRKTYKEINKVIDKYIMIIMLISNYFEYLLLLSFVVVIVLSLLWRLVFDRIIFLSFCIF